MSILVNFLLMEDSLWIAVDWSLHICVCIYLYNLIIYLAVLGLRCFLGLLSSCGAQASPCGGFSCCGAQTLGWVCFSSCGSWALEHRLNRVAHGLSRFMIFRDQGSNPCFLHWQMDSLPLSHQGSYDWLIFWLYVLFIIAVLGKCQFVSKEASEILVEIALPL